MALLHNWSTTSAINLVIPAMELIMNDDDKTNIYVEYLHNGIKFSNWGGDVQVKVYPNQGQLCESYTMWYSIIGKPDESPVVYDRSQLMSMCKEINAFIQHYSTN